MPDPGPDDELTEESPLYGAEDAPAADATDASGAAPAGPSAEMERKYRDVIVEAFRRHRISEGEAADWMEFTKDELAEIGKQYNIPSRNLPDLVYTYRARHDLPREIVTTGHWAIVEAGRGRYAFQRLHNPPRFDINFGEYKSPPHSCR